MPEIYCKKHDVHFTTKSCPKCLEDFDKEKEINEENEMWRKHAEEMKNMRRHRRDLFDKLAQDFRELGFTVRQVNSYQYRINDAIDIFPSNKRFFDLKNKQWGDIRGITFEKFLRKFFKI